jgi:hypothetical protein
MSKHACDVHINCIIVARMVGALDAWLVIILACAISSTNIGRPIPSPFPAWTFSTGKIKYGNEIVEINLKNLKLLVVSPVLHPSRQRTLRMAPTVHARWSQPMSAFRRAFVVDDQLLMAHTFMCSCGSFTVALRSRSKYALSVERIQCG